MVTIDVFVFQMVISALITLSIAFIFHVKALQVFFMKHTAIYIVRFFIYRSEILSGYASKSFRFIFINKLLLFIVSRYILLAQKLLNYTH